MNEKIIKIIDWRTGEHTTLPKKGPNSWACWLFLNGYEDIEQQKLGVGMFELYREAKTNLYAVYCLFFGLLDIEALHINIPTEERARKMMLQVRQKLEPLTLMNWFFSKQ